VEPENGDYRTGGNQGPNGVVNFGPDSGDPDLIQKNLDELTKSFFRSSGSARKKATCD